MRSSPVIIIGAHRSGTTATARALELLGLEIGQRLDSHRESKPMQQLHDGLLHRYGASWHHPQPFFEAMKEEDAVESCAAELRSTYEQRFARTFGYRGLAGWWRVRRINRGRPWGWKEPRTTLFARSWLRVFPEARVIHVIRHPLAVAASIRQRELRFRAAGDQPKAGLERLDYCLRLALTYVDLGEAVREFTPNYFWLRFESLQTAPTETLRELSKFSLLNPSETKIVRAAASIRPAASTWDTFSPADMKAVEPMRDSLKPLGYDLPQ